MPKTIKAINWNKLEDEIYKLFWDQNIRQFWVDEEIPVSEDRRDWDSNNISAIEKDTYEKVLAGLTLLDTEQGSVGMTQISLKVENPHAKAIMNFMGAMEQMHAKSYSTIFSTLSSTKRINELFAWVEENKHLQSKLEIIEKHYLNITDNQSLYLSMAASVLLETFLFYSGFFYPLYFAGQGKMIHSAEIISLIIRDESVHGVFIGLMAQKELAKMDPEISFAAQQEVYQILEKLMTIEEQYTKELYDQVGLTAEVIKFIQYNADKALMNLGLEPKYHINENDVNPIVMNGIDTTTKNHDFFSTKGNGYIKTTNVEALSDDDFEI